MKLPIKPLLVASALSLTTSCSETSQEVFGIDEQTPVEDLVVLSVIVKESDEVEEQTEYSIRADVSLDVGDAFPEYDLSWQLVDIPTGFSMPLTTQTDAPDNQSIIHFVTPDVDQDTHVNLQLTVSYNNGDELKNLIKTVDLNILANSQIVITGAIVDEPIPNAKVSVQLGDLLFQTFADSKGEYSMELEFADDDLVAVVTALGGGDYSEVEFKSYLGDGSKLQDDSGNDGVVTSDENDNINVTNISTAEYVLIEDVLAEGAEVTTQTELDELTTQLDVNEVLEVAAVIKAVVDDPKVVLPEGSNSVLELLQDKEATEELVDELVAENPTIIEDLIAEIIADPVLTPVDEGFQFSNKFFVTQLGNYQSLTTEIMNFEDDGTGDWATYYGLFDVTWSRNSSTGVVTANFQDGAFVRTDCYMEGDAENCYDRYLQSATINKLTNSGVYNSLYIKYSYELVHTTSSETITETETRTFSALTEQDIIAIDAAALTASQWAIRVLDESLDNSGFSYAELPHEIVYASFNPDGTGTYQRVKDGVTVNFNWQLQLGVLGIQVKALDNPDTGTTDHEMTYVQTYDRLGVRQMSLLIDAPDFTKVNSKMLNKTVATTATFAPVNSDLDIAATSVEHRFALLESATKAPTFFLQFDQGGSGFHEQFSGDDSFTTPFSWQRNDLGVVAKYYRSEENGKVASCDGEAAEQCYLERVRNFEILDVVDGRYIVRVFQIFYEHLGGGEVSANFYTSYIGIFEIQEPTAKAKATKGFSWLTNKIPENR